MHIKPPIHQRTLRILPRHRPIPTFRPNTLHPLRRKGLFLFAQPTRRLRIIRQAKQNHTSEKTRRDAFEDEEPLPTDEIGDAIQVADAVGDAAAKGTGEGGAGEEGGDAEGTLFGAVPEGEVEDEAGVHA